MRYWLGLGLAFSLAVWLASCSSRHEKSFTMTGVRPPAVACPIDPTRLGQVRRMADIVEENGCEVRHRYEVSSLAQVQFSQPATLNCGMIYPVNEWLNQVVQPAAEKYFDERVTSVTIAASYSCRPRDNRKGAKLSEHGFGNAIDVMGFTLANGRKISVADDYYGWFAAGKFLRQLREGSCQDFMTVLGPGSDRYHRDHLHLDLQNRPSGRHFCQ